MYGPWQQPVQFIPVFPPQQQGPVSHPTSLKELKDYHKFMKKLLSSEEEAKKKKDEEEKKKKPPAKPWGGYLQSLMVATVLFPIVAPLWALLVAGAVKISWLVLQSVLQ